MTAASLLASLKDAWPKVATVPGWETRGGAWKFGEPVAVMEHHTALPVPYPVDRLYGTLLKCNINTKPDGTVWLVAYEACNYSSGLGSLQVLNEVRAGKAPRANARERGLTDDVNGNPYFFNFENDHVGDGRSIPAIQHDAIVTATRVVNEHFGISSSPVISHAEWTARKRDPYWNGDLRAIEAIREQLEDDMPTLDEIGALLDKKLEITREAANKPGHSYLVSNSLLLAQRGSGDNRTTYGATIANTHNMAAAILALLHGDADDVDEAEVARIVLQGLSPAAIADALDDDLAHAVADEIDRRERERLGPA